MTTPTHADAAIEPPHVCSCGRAFYPSELVAELKNDNRTLATTQKLVSKGLLTWEKWEKRG